MEGPHFDDSLLAALQRGWGLHDAAAMRILRQSGEGVIPPVAFEGTGRDEDQAAVMTFSRTIRATVFQTLEKAGLVASSDPHQGTFAATSAGLRVCAHLRELAEKYESSLEFRRAAARDATLAAVYTWFPQDVGEIIHRGHDAWYWERGIWGKVPRGGLPAHDPVLGIGWRVRRRMLTNVQDRYPAPAWLCFAGEHLMDDGGDAYLYLVKQDLISDGSTTKAGDACIEDFGGSVSAYLRHHRRIEDQSAQVTNHADAKPGNDLTVTDQDLAALITVLRGCADDEAIPLAAEVLELKKAAAENSGELPAAKIEEASHTGLWSRVRDVVGDVTGSAVSGVLKGLLGIG